MLPLPRQDKLARGGFPPSFLQNLLPKGALRDLVPTFLFGDTSMALKLGGTLVGEVTHREGSRRSSRDL